MVGEDGGVPRACPIMPFPYLTAPPLCLQLLQGSEEFDMTTPALSYPFILTVALGGIAYMGKGFKKYSKNVLFSLHSKLL